MPIPALNPHGLLPQGTHDCTLPEIEDAFAWNDDRRLLLQKFRDCLAKEIRSRFTEPIYVDGSFVTDKEQPNDIDMALDLTASSVGRQQQGRKFMGHQDRLMSVYRVDFWIDVPGQRRLRDFFRAIGGEAASAKGLRSEDSKGILRIGEWASG